MGKMSTENGTLKKIKVNHNLQPPGKYQVIFMNDDVTAMDFVIAVLNEIFGHSLEVAQELTTKIHLEGSACVGVMNYELAEQKAMETTILARNNSFPLDVKIKPDG
jgi:ATP-dependent Clp protease adaptor protein ClpS